MAKSNGASTSNGEREPLLGSRDGDGIQQQHGPLIDDVMPPKKDTAPANPNLMWSRVRSYNQDAFSEFWGTFILVLFGNASIAQVVLSNGTKGDWQSINWGWGLGILLGVYVAGRSGAHLNPAVTFTNCVFRKFPWSKFPIYTLAQTLGAFAASGVVYANYMSAVDRFEGEVGLRTLKTAGIFATYPVDFVSKSSMFVDEFIASSILMFCIYALKDDANLGAGPFTPLGLFFIIFGIGAAFGWETGYAINLARDFGPRLMSYLVGYGSDVWTANSHYFWVPMVAPFAGCLFGGLLYDMFLYTGESPINSPYLGLRDQKEVSDAER